MSDKDIFLFFLLTGKMVLPHKNMDSYIKVKGNMVSLVVFNDDIEVEYRQERKYIQ